jgi:hypothetical protein
MWVTFLTVLIYMNSFGISVLFFAITFSTAFSQEQKRLP